MGLLGQEGAGTSPTGFNGEDAPEQPNASAEEQQLYDQFVTNGYKILYGTQDHEGPVRKEIIGLLSQGQNGDPTEPLAQTAVWLTMLVEKSAEQGGAHIPDEIVFHAGRELFEELATIADAAKIHTYSQKELQGAWYKALDMYREANTKDEQNPNARVDPEQLKGQFAQLDEADRTGQGAELLGMDPARAAEDADRAAEMDEQNNGPQEEQAEQ